MKSDRELTNVKMPARKGLLAPQNNFLDTIATRFDGTRKFYIHSHNIVITSDKTEMKNENKCALLTTLSNGSRVDCQMQRHYYTAVTNVGSNWARHGVRSQTSWHMYVCMYVCMYEEIYNARFLQPNKQSRVRAPVS